MPTRSLSLALITSLVLVHLAAPPASGQSSGRSSTRVSCWIVPQRGVFTAGSTATAAVRITGVTAGVVIVEQVATTTLEVDLHNTDRRPREAVMLLPVPRGAAVRTFAFSGPAAEPTARLLPHAEAARTYREIVRRLRDPALLEFVGCGLVRSSLFPIPAGGTARIRLTYEQVVTAEGSRFDYVLPRTEALDYRIPWKISVRVKSRHPIATLYSPSHDLDILRAAAGTISARLRPGAGREPGPFRISWLRAGNTVTASLLACPDPDTGGGTFLLLAGLPPASAGASTDAPGARKVHREVTLVLDRSGSMRGEKIEQAKEAARQILAGLEPGETFNLITYNDTVSAFAAAPVVKDRDAERRAVAYIDGLRAGGGTNIHAALTEALRPSPPEGMLPLVLFLTDGLPTAGQTSEVAIRDVALKANPHERRIFTFGVGVNVNTPLLEKIASASRGAPTFVLPQENVEVKVGQVFRRLKGPALAAPTVVALDAAGSPDPSRVHDVLPAPLPDLFDGDRLVLLGRYTGTGPIGFELSGTFHGAKRRFRFDFDLGRASTRNAFVARLWASRKIGALVDEIRQSGAAPAAVAMAASRRSSLPPAVSATSSRVSFAPTAAVPAPAPADPRWRELVDEVVRLSTRYGVLTEYTAFLAREGTDLSAQNKILAEADRNFRERGVACRWGTGAVNQSLNGQKQQKQSCLNNRNSFLDANLNRVEVTRVQQVADRAFFRRGPRWVDSRLLARPSAKPDRVVVIGTKEFTALVAQLAAAHRQACLGLRGEILIEVNGKAVLVRAKAERAL